MKKKIETKEVEHPLSDNDMKELMKLFTTMTYGLAELPQHSLVVSVYNKMNKYFIDKEAND